VANILDWGDTSLSLCIRDLRCVFTVWSNTESSRRGRVYWGSRLTRLLRHRRWRHIVV
jgi:hypothetical protein